MRRSSDIGAAVIGSGFIGTVHIEALRRLGVRIHGLLEVSPEHGVRRAADLGLPRAYADMDEMLADERVEIVHVTSPNALHFPQVRDILAAGKHVVCEKPLATTSRESAELVRLAREAGVVNAVNFNIRFYPVNQHLAQLVADGGLGEVRLVTGHYFQDWLLLDTDWNWRLDPAEGGALRAVGDIGSHWLDLAGFVGGLRIESVMADLVTFVKVRHQPAGPVETFSTERAASTIPREMTTDDAATILLRFSNGARGAVAISQVSAGRKNSLQYEIDGSTAAAAWDSERPDELWLGRRESPNELLHPQSSPHERCRRGRGEPARRPRRRIRATLSRPPTGRSTPMSPPAARRSGPPTRPLPMATTRCSSTTRSPRAPARGAGPPWTAHDGDPAPSPPTQPPRGSIAMKLGFLTAPFPETPLMEVADWAAGSGFEVLEIACWPRTSGPTRRYAGTSHIDVVNLGESQGREIADEIAAKGLAISGLGFYPNPLHPDPAHRAQVIGHLEHVITAARKMGIPLVNTFMGGDGARNQDQNWEEALRVWPDIVRFARDNGVKITLENCPMLFSYDEWPGGHNIATTPRMWRRILEQWGDTIGLNFDPSHLVLQMIDMGRFIREFGPHILHYQAKDLMIDRDGLYERGIFSNGIGWQIPRIPGLGDVSWAVVFSELYRAGYEGDCIIEHEDRRFEGSDEKVKQGFLIARDVLRPYCK